MSNKSANIQKIEYLAKLKLQSTVVEGMKK